MSPLMFAPELIEQLGGDDWLRTRRRERAAVAMEVEAPSVHAEEWRYSRIDRLPFDTLTPVVSDPSDVPAVPEVVHDVLAAIGPTSGHVVVVDGTVASHELATAARDAGVAFGPAPGPELLGSAMGTAPDLFAAWNDALMAVPLVLDIPAGVELEAPFVVVHHLLSPAVAAFLRLSVRAGDASSASVVEVFTSGAVASLVAPVTELALGRAARLRHTAVQDLGPEVWQVGALVSDVGQESTFSSGVAALGGDYARLRVDCRLSGRGASGNVASAYLGSGTRMIDLRTFQEHAAPDTTSDLYFKGAVDDASHSVYTGLIRIRPEARGTDAVQANRVIKLSEQAWAESVPNLEIENNDVRCAHASTVGPVDPEHRYYLESRGVPPRAAERLVVGGFFDDALEHFPVREVRGFVGDRLDAELDRGIAELAGGGS